MRTTSAAVLIAVVASTWAQKTPFDFLKTKTLAVRPIPAPCQAGCTTSQLTLNRCTDLTDNSAVASCLCTTDFQTTLFNCFVCIGNNLPSNDFSIAQADLDQVTSACAAFGSPLPSLTLPGQASTRSVATTLIPTTAPPAGPSGTASPGGGSGGSTGGTGSGNGGSSGGTGSGSGGSPGGTGSGSGGSPGGTGSGSGGSPGGTGSGIGGSPTGSGSGSATASGSGSGTAGASGSLPLNGTATNTAPVETQTAPLSNNSTTGSETSTTGSTRGSGTSTTRPSPTSGNSNNSFRLTADLWMTLVIAFMTLTM